MSKALPVVLGDLATDDYGNMPAAYYRFDDGGRNAQDFAYPLRDEIAADWPHSLKVLDGNTLVNAELRERMLSSWGASGDDTTGAFWQVSHVLQRAVNMNGGGNSDYDPIPDGWQQLYWGGMLAACLTLTGYVYAGSGKRRPRHNTPEVFCAEGSSLIDL